MSINIKNREAEALLGEIKAATGKGTTELLLELLRAEAERQRKVRDIDERRRRLRDICREAAAKLPVNPPTPDEIIGYDEDGLPR
jgi:antitoxin VapB